MRRVSARQHADVADLAWTMAEGTIRQGALPTYDDAAAEVELQRRADHARCRIRVVGTGWRCAAGPPREECRELFTAVRAHAHALHVNNSRGYNDLVLDVPAVTSGPERMAMIFCM